MRLVFVAVVVLGMMALQTVAAGMRRRSPRLRRGLEVISSSVAFTAAAGPGGARRTSVRKGGRRALAVNTRARSSTPSSPSLLAAGRRAPVADAPASKRPKRVPKPKGAVAVGSNKKATTLGRTREERKRGEGFDVVIGVDEAGRGPFAGPVVAAACFVPPNIDVPGIQDSKKVAQHGDREALYEELTKSPGVIWATSEVGSGRIDEINILEATKEAMTVCSKAAKAQAKESESSKSKPFILVDGNFTPSGLSEVDSECVIGGDGLEYCIAAASIIAKVTRDRLMIEFGERWPVYGFERHKGYGTSAHRDAIREHGMVEIHRRSFLKNMEASGCKLFENKG